MKKLNMILMTGILFVTVTTQAQVKQGSIMLGGNLSVSSEKQNNNSTFSSKQSGIGITPVFGYAVRDNLIIGGDLYFSESKFKGTPLSGNNTNSYRGIGMFVRHYHDFGHSGFSLFVQGRIGYEHYQYTASGTSVNDKIKRNEVRATVVPGVSYRISKRWQLETGLSNLLSLSAYSQKQTVSGGNPVEYTSKGVALSGNINPSSSIFLGLRFLLGK